jgi:adenosylhomocysteine nucleosidase
LTATDSISPIPVLPLSTTAPPKQIAIFAATFLEVKAVEAAFPAGIKRRIDGMPVLVFTAGSREYWLARTGVGPEKAGLAAARLLGHQPFSLAVSTGFACALIATEVGALLAGREVVRTEGRGVDVCQAIEVPGAERDMVMALVEGAKPAGHIGRFVSTEYIVGSASEKRRFSRSTGAIGLDMESAAVAVEAQRAQVPFVIIRTVSDLLDEDLPLDFNLFLRPTAWLKGVGALLGNPSSVMGLLRLRRQSQAAAINLTAFFQRYAAGISADGGAAGLQVDRS